MKKTATLIRTLKSRTTSVSAVTQRLYRLNPPLENKRFVVVSAANVLFSGPETYIFAANQKGTITNWSEMTGSFRGALDHERALRNAGYEVKS